MTDREILDEIYNRLCNMLEANDNGTGRALKSFIEQEWQRRDEEEMDDHPLTKSDEGQMYNVDGRGDIHSTDVKEIEYRQGLQIGEDGTVDDQYNEGDAGDNDYQG